MRNLITLFFSIVLAISNAAEFQRINCISDSSNYLLKIKENLDNANYLLYCQRYTQSPNLITENNGYQLIKQNTNGSTIWQFDIPYSNKGFYNIYFPQWIGYLLFKINDIPYKTYTKLDNDILLHYSSFDNIVSDSAGLRLFNNVLRFGVLNSTTGALRTPVFAIDTLQWNGSDTGVVINKIIVSKENDSIYRMAVQYKVEKGWYMYTIFSDSYSTFYTINVNRKSVIKKEYKNTITDVIRHKNQFYAIQISNNPSNSLVYLCRIGLLGEVNLLSFVKQTDGIFSFIDNADGTYLKLLETPGYPATQLNYFNIDTATLSIVNSFHFNTIPSDSNLHVNYESMLPIDYPVFTNYFSFTQNQYNSYNKNYIDFDSYKKEGETRFLLHKKSYSIADTVYHNYNTQSIARVNLINGNIEAERMLPALGYGLSNSTYINPAIPFRDDIFPTNDVLITQDSVTGYTYNADSTAYQLEHHVILLTKTNANLTPLWTIALPQFIERDSLKYYCAITQFTNSTAFMLYPINYKNQFIVALSYERLLDSTGNYVETLYSYFLVNKNDGSVQNLNIPPFANSSRLSTLGTFFCGPSDDLSFITSDSCSSNLDIGIYKMQEINTGIKNTQHIPSIAFTIYPNPASAAIQVNFLSDALPKDAFFRIVDITGKTLLQEKTYGATELFIPTAQLNSGSYFLQIIANDKSVAKKFEVIH